MKNLYSVRFDAHNPPPAGTIGVRPPAAMSGPSSVSMESVAFVVADVAPAQGKLLREATPREVAALGCPPVAVMGSLRLALDRRG